MKFCKELVFELLKGWNMMSHKQYWKYWNLFFMILYDLYALDTKWSWKSELL